MPKKIVIVGGVAGGASCAARMRRLDEEARIVMFEKGDYISFANCGLPYHIGQLIKDRDALLIQTPRQFKRRFNVDVRTGSEVIRVEPGANRVIVRAGQETYEEAFDFLVLSPGSAPIRPLIPGIDHPRIATLRNIPDMDRIKALVDGGSIRRTVVVGGGFIGLEMAENLRHRGLDVAVVELADQVFAPADPEMAGVLHQHLMLNGIRLYLGNGVGEFVHREDESDVVLTTGARIPADLIVLAIGVLPDTAFLKESGVELSSRGAIVVDDRMRTNRPGIYAVGDAIEVTDFVSGAKVHVPLAGPANRQGRIAADNIAGIESAYKKTQGTAICKVFDLTAAVTGINERNARRSNIAYLKSYTHGSSHAGYYPGAFPLSIKILFRETDGKLLGAQVVGKDGVDKRIDVFATALRHGLTVYDLAELELGYAPPYGSAKDPVNIAGFVAQNILENRMPVFYAEDLASFDPSRGTLLDVRTPSEHEQGRIDGSTLIPLDGLRGRLGELDRHKEILVYCQVGLRGYLAVRLLMQNGFAARNLSGGYKTYAASRALEYDPTYVRPLTESVCSSPTSEARPGASTTVDACGLQCPGPIAKLKQAIDLAREGDSVAVRATDQGFALDVPAWCTRTGNTLVSLGQHDGIYTAVVKKGAPGAVCTTEPDARNRKTMVIFSNDFDKMMAAFIIANGAASMGSEVTMFFTFWGLNLLRKAERHGSIRKDLIGRMFGMMMPRGPAKTTLSKMHMGGMGTFMIRQVMKRKNVYSLEELLRQARANGVRMVACTMSMDIMGIRKEELVDGVEFGGVAYYLEKADGAGYNLFV